MHISTFGLIRALNNLLKTCQFDFIIPSIYMVKGTRNVLAYERARTSTTAHKWGIHAKFFQRVLFRMKSASNRPKQPSFHEILRRCFFFVLLFLFVCLFAFYKRRCGKRFLTSDLRTQQIQKHSCMEVLVNQDSQWKLNTFRVSAIRRENRWETFCLSRFPLYTV